MKNNFFYETEPRLHEKHDFELLCEMSRKTEITYRKEQCDFNIYVIDQRNQGVIEPWFAILQTYERKKELEKAQYHYRMRAICMEYYLEVNPYAMMGNYKQCEDIYDERYGEVDHLEMNGTNQREKEYYELKNYTKQNT
jgi:hypothetical protein